MTTMTLTINGNEVAGTATELAALLTLVAEGDQPAKAPKVAPKGRKTGSKTRKTGSKSRFVRTANIAAFGEAIGVSLEGWALVDLLDSLREYGEAGSLVFDGEAVTGTPKGWDFGPSARTYLATGNWG